MKTIIFVNLLSSFLFLSIPTVLAQEQQWVTYENPYFGIAIQHPPNWEVKFSNTDASPPIEGLAKQIVEIALTAQDDQANALSFSEGPGLDADLKIYVQVAESYLDTETMQVKGSSLDDFIEGKKQEVGSLAFPTGELDLQVRQVRENKTTIGGVPAWQIETISYVLGKQGTYSMDTLMMKDNHLYNLEFWTDPLRVPELLPMGQKMIDSIRITTPQLPVSTPNANESSNPISPFDTPSPEESGSLIVEDRIQNNEEEEDNDQDD